MKARWWVGILLLFLVLGGYLVLSPYFALRGLQAAIERQDAAALERYVDFPRVRENLEADLNAAMAKELEKAQDDPFAALGLLFAGSLIQALVDALLRLRVLPAWARGKTPGRPVWKRCASGGSNGRGFHGSLSTTGMTRKPVW